MKEKKNFNKVLSPPLVFHLLRRQMADGSKTELLRTLQNYTFPHQVNYFILRQNTTLLLLNSCIIVGGVCLKSFFHFTYLLRLLIGQNLSPCYSSHHHMLVWRLLDFP